MDRLTDFLFRRSRLVVAAWVLSTLVAAGFAVGLEGRAVPGGEASSSSQSELVARELGANDVPGLFVVVTGEAARPSGDEELETIRRRTAEAAGVRGVEQLPLPPPDPAAGPVTVLGITTAGGVDGAIDVAEHLLHEDDLAPSGSQAFLGGYGAHREELVQLSRSDLLRAEQVGLPIVLVVLLLTFGSLWATLVPLAIGLTALVGGLGAAGALAFGVPFSEYVTNAASMIGLALAVDYAMFLVQRVREGLLHGLDVEESVREAMRTTGAAIAWSGLTVVLALSTMFLVDSRSMRTAGLGMILVTIAAMATALLVGPIVIRALGYRLLPRHDRRRIERGLLVAIPGQRRTQRELAGFWGRWGTRVTEQPVRWLVLGLAVLGALGAPALSLSEKVDLPSASMMPADSHVRQATEIASQAYGPGVLAPLEIVVEGSRPAAERVATVLPADPEVLSARLIPLAQEDRFRVSVATVHAPSDHRTRDLVRSLRDGALAGELSGVRYQVGGEAAAREDATDALFDSLPLMLSVLLVLVFALLVPAMRSIVLPLKAILLVLVSLAATAGGLILLSTTGPGAALIGWSEPADLHPIVPITIVAVVVALSTDYEVILISRIAEHHDLGHDNATSIVHGVARTGRVISSAAAIMIAVFFGFALSDVTPLKQLGVGLAIAVAIDATLVRGVLVPAGMRLMGHWNWWLPTLSSTERPLSHATAPAHPDLGRPDHAGEALDPAARTVLPDRPRRVWTR